MKHFELHCFIQFLFFVFEITGQSITLRPEGQATVRYGEVLKLTCLSSETGGLFKFYYEEDKKIDLALAGGSFNECSNFYQNDSTFLCNFTSNEFVLTLNSPVHNRTIFCSRSENRARVENKTIVFVQVPFSEVILNPYGMVSVFENTALTFNCLAKGGRPNGTITWYRNNTEVPASSSDVLTNGSFFNVKSTLTISFQKTESGMIIYCTAINIDGDLAIMSHNAEIDVKYAPSTAPNLTAIIFSADEGKSITLQCRLPTLGNPPIRWSWTCGGDNLTLNASNIGTKSTLNFMADKKYNESPCQCLATSPETLLSYNKTSKTKIITVFYVPTTAPDLTPVGSEIVDEGMPVTLNCLLPNLGNPPIRWSWMCGGVNLTLNASNIGTESTLNFTANREHNLITCQCIATSPKLSLSYNKSSQTTNITVFYAPFSNPVLSSDTSLPVEEGHPIILQCFLSTLGNPYIRWSWVCGSDNLTLNASNVVTRSTLTFTANRKYNGSPCQCWATSPKPSLSYNSPSAAKLIIVHFAVEIRKVVYVTGSDNMTAGYPLRIQAEIHGNPSSTVVWKNKDSNNSLLQEESVSNFSEFSLDKVTCLHTNDYIVTASNGVGKKSSKEISLNILCSPYLSTDDNLEPVAVGDERQFTIQQKYIANPMPNVVWKKIEASENTTLQNGSQHVTIFNFSTGKVRYTTILERKNITIIDVGFYNLYLENSLGHYSSTVEVIFKRKPDVPSNISVSCSEPFKAKVSWIAEFDGGGNQSFLIAFSQIDWTSEKITPSSVTEGRGENKVVTINDLQPNKEHEFKVYAKNTYGNVSTKSVYCKILDAEAEDTFLLIMSTVAVSSMVIIVIIIIVIYVYRRNIFASKRENAAGLSQRLENENDSVENQDGAELDDGLKENILYVSAGPRGNEKPEAAVYADVNKKVPVSNNNANVYAEVKKNGQQSGAVESLYSDVKRKKGFFKRDEKKPKLGRSKQTKERKKKNNPNGTDVYENSEDIAMSTNENNLYSNAGHKGLNKQEERGYKNKDGLLYVEVNFDGKQEQENAIIHGEDEKTDYATVEFPMPSSLRKASGSKEL